MARMKLRPIIALGDVPAVFDEDRIGKLAKIANLPGDADLNRFGAGIKEAAEIFARDARIPTANDLHNEIANLYKAANRQSYELVADLLERLSPQAHELLSGRTKMIGRNNESAARSPRVTAVGLHGEIRTRVARPPLRLQMPTPSDLRDEALRKDACDRVARLCLIGGQLVEGRRRPSGKRSRPVFRPLLYAPEPRRNFPRRDAERNFFMWLQIAWLEATGKMPPRTARNPDRSRALGPFARFAKECLKLAGAGHANVVELINELERQRAYVEATRVKKQLSDINP
jgi:hypothetical protein